MAKSSKGSAFERETCKLLSNWWTRNERDDVFWRSAGSGGRATQRSKRGQSTFGQYGDIQAVDPVGAPLMQFVTFELKRGYSKDTFADLIDKPLTAACKGFDAFLEQASRSAEQAGSRYWALITRRNSRRALIFFPAAMWAELLTASPETSTPVPIVRMRVRVKLSTKKHQKFIIVGMCLDDFLQCVAPDQVRKALK